MGAGENGQRVKPFCGPGQLQSDFSAVYKTFSFDKLNSKASSLKSKIVWH